MCICFSIAWVVMFTIMFIKNGRQELMQIYIDHLQAMVGLPSAAFISLFIIIILKATSGNIEFSGLGFSFKGASGQIVLFIFLYMCTAFSIKMLW